MDDSQSNLVKINLVFMGREELCEVLVEGV